jgi:hypothetical protein
MTTPDLLNALADLCDALGAFRDRIDHRGIIPPNIVAAGDAVSIALGLLPEATWQETAAALRAHAATLTPGLPEGWSVADSSIRYSDYTRHEANGPRLSSVLLYRYNDGRLSVSGDVAPPAVYAYLLARAGVGS